MKRIRKAARATSVIIAAILTALAITVLCAPEEDRIELTEAFDGLSDREEPGRQIDWDSLPAEVVAWVEVPGTGIDEPIVQASPRIWTSSAGASKRPTPAAPASS